MSASSRLDSDDLYARLGVARDADNETIRQAYRLLVRQYPPERCPEEFKLIRQAFETLGEVGTRAAYDQLLPSPIDIAISDASAAMQEENYSHAEQILKRLLVEQPDATAARNILGLCFLYQGKPAEALAQFERLLKQATPNPVWFSNRGHALVLAGNTVEAERAFQEGAKRAETPADVAARVGDLSDYYVAQNKVDKARSCITERLRPKKQRSADDLPLLLKLLRLDVMSKREIHNTLEQLTTLANTNDERRFLALRLGQFGCELIRAERFDIAVLVAAEARRLQAEDLDYDALESVAHALNEHRLQEAVRITRSHVSFAPNGWLADLGVAIRQYCESHRAFNGMTRIAAPPGLRTVNGFGTSIYGRQDADPQTQSYVATLYFVALFVPVLPLACYRVRDGKGGGWHFLGKVPFGRRQKVHLAIACGLFALFVIFSIASNSSGGSIQSGYVPPATSTTPDAPTVVRATPPSAFTVLEPRKSVWEGTVTNKGLPDSPAALRVTFDSLADTTTAFVAISQPLGGSGLALAAIDGDKGLAMVSVNDQDTIVWRARRSDDRLVGKYVIAGGRYKGQEGKWEARYSSGAHARP